MHVDDMPSRERLPGWHGRHFDSASMTFGPWEFEAAASIHEHRHPARWRSSLRIRGTRFALSATERRSWSTIRFARVS